MENSKYNATVYELRLKRTRRSVTTPLLGQMVSSPAAVAVLATALFGNEPTEVLVVFLLNARNKLIGFAEVGRGGVTSVACKPGDIFRHALVAGAASLVLVHNHPSDDTTPSPEDVKLTRQVQQAGALLGVDVLDHIVVGESGAFSFREHGIF